jgi:hypothetical protein
MVETFAVVLSKGAYIVRQHDAERILDAIDRSERHLLVDADLLGDGIHFSPVRIVLAHVIAIVKNDSRVDSPRPNTTLRLLGG